MRCAAININIMARGIKACDATSATHKHQRKRNIIENNETRCESSENITIIMAAWQQWQQHQAAKASKAGSISGENQRRRTEQKAKYAALAQASGVALKSVVAWRSAGAAWRRSVGGEPWRQHRKWHHGVSESGISRCISWQHNMASISESNSQWRKAARQQQ